MRHRAVVLSHGSRSVTVLLAGGEVRTIGWTGPMPSVGEEISVADPALTRRAAGSWAAAAAVVVLLTGGLYYGIGVGGAPSPSNTPPVGVISLDMNTSLDLDVSASGLVTRVQAYDASGRAAVAAHLHLVGVPVAGAALTLTRWAADRAPKHHGSHPLVVLAAWGETAADNPMITSDLAAAARALRDHHLQETVVTLQPVNGAILDASETAGLSVGRYLLAQILGKSPSAVLHHSLTQLMADVVWPRYTAAAGGGGSGPGGAGRKAPATTTVTGVLDGVGYDFVVVSGERYPLAPHVAVTFDGQDARLSLRRMILSLAADTMLTLNAKREVLAIAVKGGPEPTQTPQNMPPPKNP